MLRSFRGWTALAVLAILIAITGVFVLRSMRKPAFTGENVTVVEEGPREAAGAPGDTAPGPAGAPPEQPRAAATPEVPPSREPPRSAEEPVRTAQPAPPQGDQGELFRDPRFDQLLSGSQAPPRSPRPAPEQGAPVIAKSAGASPRIFEDPRSVGTDGAQPRTGAQQREPAQTVGGGRAPAGAPASPFVDPRSPIAPPVQPSAVGSGEKASAKIGTAPSRTSEAAQVRPTAGAQPFSDQRDLFGSTQRPPVISERREVVQRSAQGLNVVRRDGGDAPVFVDERRPLGDAAPAQPAQPAQPAGPPAAASSSAAAGPAASAAAAPRVVAAATPITTTLTARPAPCAPAQIASEPLDGGRMLIRVNTPCRAGQAIRFSYGNATLEHSIDAAGRLEMTLDLFAGTASPVEIVFADGFSRELPARANDLDKVEKVALIWRAPVDLDLHVFEYGATFGQAGHVWSQAPSSAMSAREQAEASRRARGFISRTDNGHGSGDKIEVYTLFRHPDQAAGTVSIAVDHATRGDTASGAACGAGPQAEVRFETIVVARGRVVREAGVLAAVACGAAMSSEARYGVVHQIRVNR